MLPEQEIARPTTNVAPAAANRPMQLASASALPRPLRPVLPAQTDQ